MNGVADLKSLTASLAVQRRVIGALFLREVLTRYGRHNIGFLWLFVEPMTFTLGVTALWSALGATHGTDIPITAFALTGYSSVLLWRNMPSRCIRAIEPNLALMFHRNVKIIDIFIARLLLEGGGATISFVILSCFFIFIGWVDPPEDILLVARGWLMIAWFGSSLGLLLGALAEETETVDKFWHPLSYFLFPLSGAAFTVEAAPEALRGVISYLPMVHGVEMVREGYFGSKVTPHYSMEYMTLFCLALTVLALAQVRRVARKVIPE